MTRGRPRKPPPPSATVARAESLEAHDVALFRSAVKDARPIRSSQRVTHVDKPPPVPVHSLLDNHNALAESVRGGIPWEQSMEAGEELVYLRENLSRDVLRKLRRGHWVVQDSVDLHGLTRQPAAGLLAEFLAACVRRGLRCIRVVHGKGLGSPNRESVLRGMMSPWLSRRSEVLAFCQAPANLGGSGATLVLLAGTVAKAGKASNR